MIKGVVFVASAISWAPCSQKPGFTKFPGARPPMHSVPEWLKDARPILSAD